jgi:hypothetical protein
VRTPSAFGCVPRRCGGGKRWVEPRVSSEAPPSVHLRHDALQLEPRLSYVARLGGGALQVEPAPAQSSIPAPAPGEPALPKKKKSFPRRSRTAPTGRNAFRGARCVERSPLRWVPRERARRVRALR